MQPDSDAAEAVPVSRTAPTATAADVAVMDKHLVGGIAWTAVGSWSSQILSWAALFIIARQLRPSDFGLIGIAAVYLVLQIFSEFGLGSAVITIRDLTEDDVAQINTFSAISGVVGFLISCAAAVPLGLFFRSPALPLVVVAMSTGFLIGGVKTLPYSLLQTELRFKLLSIINGATAVVQSLCTLTLAWRGYGLGAGRREYSGTAVSGGLTLGCRPHRFAYPRLSSIRLALNFSWQVLLARLCWAFYCDADFLVAGRTLGASALGAYTFARNLACVPVEKITTLVGHVTPAFFSANQADHDALCRYLRSLTEGLSLITFPAPIGLGMVAPEFVSVVLGKAWSGAIAPLQILVFYGSGRSIGALLGPLLIVLRQTRLQMWNNLVAAIVMPAVFYVGSHWSASGIAWGWVIGYPIIVLPLYRRAFGKLAMPTRLYLRALKPALHGTVAIIVVVGGLKWIMPSEWALYERLAIEVISGVVTYWAVLWWLHVDRIRGFVDLYRRMRSPNVAAPAG